MAMRPRGGRAGPNREPRLIVGRVYETFKPMSEWRQGDDYDTLLVYLPGFQKEYIKVTTEDLNVVRVRGERLIAANKWSRFQEDFRVPENCEMRGIRARFEGGILTITMPRKIIIAPPPPTTTAPPRTTVAPPPPTPTAPPPTTAARPPTTTAPQPTTRVAPKSEETPLRRRKEQEEALVQKPNKDHQDSKQKASPSNESGKKQEEAVVQKPKDHQDIKQKATSSNAALESEKKPEKPRSPLEGSTTTLPPPPPHPMPTKQEPSKTTGPKADDQFTFGSRPSSAPKKDKDNNTVDKGKSKEAVVEEKKMGMESRKRESEGSKVTENAVVKGGNGWQGLNEDRKMVVNFGVAILVIVALGYHVSYTIGLIGKGK